MKDSPIEAICAWDAAGRGRPHWPMDLIPRLWAEILEDSPEIFLDQLNLPEEEYRKNGLMDFPRWHPYEYGRTFEYGTFTGPGWRMDDYVERAHDFIESKNEGSIAFSRYRRKKR